MTTCKKTFIDISSKKGFSSSSQLNMTVAFIYKRSEKVQRGPKVATGKGNLDVLGGRKPTCLDY